MSKALVVVLLFGLALAGEDYYKLLGVARDADSAAIKKAFKKQSLKYHPDKNTDDPKNAEKKFMEIANAYETLMDSEKRQIYDQHGEEGLKKSGNPNQQNMQHNDLFRHFFNQGGNQGGFHFNFNQGSGFNAGGFQKPQYESFYKGSDVFELSFSGLNSLFRRTQIWMVNFYHPNCGHCRDLKDEWISVADKLYGIIKVAAVRCDEEEELCEEYGVTSYPTIVYFPENTAQTHQVYTGKRQYKEIADFAISRMQSFVRIVNKDNYSDFYEGDPGKAKVLLFTNRKSTPPVLRVLSKEFKDRVVFGEVRSSEERLIQRFGVKDLPTILGLTGDSEGVRYEGGNRRDEMERWLREFLYNNSHQGPLVRELTRSLAVSGTCGPTDAKLCFVWFTTKEKKELELPSKLAEEYSADPITFVWLDTARYPNFASHFDSSRAVLLKSKRKKYLDVSQFTSLKQTSDTISLVLSGGGDFKSLRSWPELVESRAEL